ncbi:uncharacterized protein C8A04DRAFT_13134 [Dichotomopilus funicola]|uniref:Uncharacterized protein n=1 Tax=Dichotomopilus funicola TaxID=1934379 RepID=A0AAN6ZMC4_9PEZI|nr:hypothetical protein C8A04DRAFT_13134 [Dichotomopilus funicola]
MVTLEQMRASNARIPECLPAGLVAVFVGGTSGIGEATMKELAKHAVQPRIYFLGRSERAAVRITNELAAINPGGQYHFLQADLSLLQTVDEVCYELKGHEGVINLLFLTAGTMVTGKETPEHLYYPTALNYYSRIRLIVNLLPLLQKAPFLRRVVTVFGGTKEGAVSVGDLQGRSLGLPLSSRTCPPTPPASTSSPPRPTPSPTSTGTSPLNNPKHHASHLAHLRAHTASMTTLALESLALEAPDVSFVHTFPGFVRSTHVGRELRKGGKAAKAAAAAASGGNGGVGLMRSMLNKMVSSTSGSSASVVSSLAEAGERQLFVATSGRFPARSRGWGGRNNSTGGMSTASTATGNSVLSAGGNGTAGVVLVEGSGVNVARGSDARQGSGVYSVGLDAEAKGEEAVRRLREEDLVRRVWLHTIGEFLRVTGTEFV